MVGTDAGFPEEVPVAAVAVAVGFGCHSSDMLAASRGDGGSCAFPS
jgi:hypothetical protein